MHENNPLPPEDHSEISDIGPNYPFRPTGQSEEKKEETTQTEKKLEVSSIPMSKE